MTEKVDLAGLPDRVDEYGPAAYLVTVGEGGAPHVVSVTVARAGTTLQLAAGRTSRRNATANPTVTLLWPAGPDGQYSLLVDGRAAVPAGGDGGGPDTPLEIEPTSAILHRDAGGQGPTCLPVTPTQ
ncbi:MAG TPA: pyridoxamine 5'-phosphate oxidase family protein [Acidimicrobiales bacterium]|nr:pyridoxamine 5'-phosphate oxidase family protein [Acidimicrobiales bacterium]